MVGSKLVLLVPDSETRERVRELVIERPIVGLQASIHVAHDAIQDCVRDTRRSLFEGPLAVLTEDDSSALLALAAGADEAFALDSTTLDGDTWVRMVDRARLRSESRRELMQRAAALSELERACALGRLVSGVADELTGPLNNALLSLQMLKRELDPLYLGMAHLRDLCSVEGAVPREELDLIVSRSRGTGSTPVRAIDVLADVTESCESIAQVASDLGLRDLGLRGLAGEAREERHEYVDLRGMLDKILRLFRRSAAKTTHIDRDYAEDVPDVFAPRGRIAQVLISLLANSLDSLRGAPSGVHRLRITVRSDDCVVTVTISDTGPGLRTDLLEHLFDSMPPPAAPTATKASGGGLELAVARTILRSLGGDLIVESLRGEGATYVAVLPRPKQREAGHSGTIRKPNFGAYDGREAQKRTVLVLEPNTQVLGALSRLLRERYEVLLALGGTEARILIANGTRPDAIVSASDDPESRSFLEWLLVERADLTRRLVLTTDADDPTDELLGLPWLDKPIEPAALFRAIEARFVAPLRKARSAGSKPARLAKQG